MQRLRKQSVTLRYNRPTPNVPILVPTQNPKPDGFATFGGPPYEGVQVLLEGDFTNILLHQLSEHARAELRELIKFREGIAEHEDESREAYEARWTDRFRAQAAEVGPADHPVAPEEFDWAGFARAMVVWMKNAQKDHANLEMALSKEKKIDYESFEDPISFLSREISQKLSKTRLVLWWKGSPRTSRDPFSKGEIQARVAHLLAERSKLLVPAIYCPDLETACYVYELFRFCGRGFGICLECGDIFQKSEGGSLYCSTAHGDAHRIRRWRARKKLAEAK